MASIGLDLSSSKARLSRAREHLDTLKGEIEVVLNERHPYATRIGKIDPQSGWCSIYLTPRDLREPHLGIVFGEVTYNLRSALDYLVTALADASGVRVTTKHQFPIFDILCDYERVIGTAGALKERGPLAGIGFGVDLIEQLQPYHRQPDPHADPLWHVHRFSNADKHREISAYMPMLGAGQVRLLAHDGTVVEMWQPRTLPRWSPEQEYEVGRYRFQAPFPSQVSAQTQMAVSVHFGTRAFGRDPEGHAIDVQILGECCDHVAMVIDLLELL